MKEGIRRWRWLGVAVVALGCVLMLLVVQQSFSQVKKGKTRLMLTKHWMAGVQGPNCAALGKLLQDKGPADDKAWTQAEQHAALLNEASYVLMQDGRCPDATWANACTALQEGSTALLKAIEAKNLVEAQAAFKAMTQACTSCHDAHRKKDKKE